MCCAQTLMANAIADQAKDNGKDCRTCRCCELAPAKPLTGRHVLVYLIAFFGVIIGVNLTMATLATNTFRGVVVDSSYKAGMSFNKERMALAAQEAMGWKVEARERWENDKLIFDVSILDRDMKPIQGASVEGVLTRYADRKATQTVTFTSKGNGLYEGAMSEAPTPGAWHLSLKVLEEGAVKFRSENKVMLP
jgi:nitrogen fixation protein FixH